MCVIGQTQHVIQPNSLKHASSVWLCKAEPLWYQMDISAFCWHSPSSLSVFNALRTCRSTILAKDFASISGCFFLLSKSSCWSHTIHWKSIQSTYFFSLTLGFSRAECSTGVWPDSLNLMCVANLARHLMRDNLPAISQPTQHSDNRVPEIALALS